jgi:hypothetical protein
MLLLVVAVPVAAVVVAAVSGVAVLVTPSMLMPPSVAISLVALPILNPTLCADDNQYRTDLIDKHRCQREGLDVKGIAPNTKKQRRATEVKPEDAEDIGETKARPPKPKARPRKRATEDAEVGVGTKARPLKRIRAKTSLTYSTRVRLQGILVSRLEHLVGGLLTSELTAIEGCEGHAVRAVLQGLVENGTVIVTDGMCTLPVDCEDIADEEVRVLVEWIVANHDLRFASNAAEMHQLYENCGKPKEHPCLPDWCREPLSEARTAHIADLTMRVVQRQYPWGVELSKAKHAHRVRSAREQISELFTFAGMTEWSYRESLSVPQQEWEPKTKVAADNTRLVRLVTTTNDERRAVQDGGGLPLSHFATGHEVVAELPPDLLAQTDCQVGGMRRVCRILELTKAAQVVCRVFIMNTDNPTVESIVKCGYSGSHWVAVCVCRPSFDAATKVVVIDTLASCGTALKAFFKYCRQHLRLETEFWALPTSGKQLMYTCGYQAAAVMQAIHPSMEASLDPGASISRLLGLLEVVPVVAREPQ